METLIKMLDPSRTNSIGRKGILKTSNNSSNNAGNVHATLSHNLKITYVRTNLKASQFYVGTGFRIRNVLKILYCKRKLLFESGFHFSLKHLQNYVKHILCRSIRLCKYIVVKCGRCRSLKTSKFRNMTVD